MVNSFPAIIPIIILAPWISWLFLRWRDWRSLAKMSKKLYALVHAETSQETKDNIDERKQNNLWIPVLLVLLFIALYLGYSQ
ncbi:MAG: hypothetical protein V3V18_15000 [Methylococcales bacterium]